MDRYYQKAKVYASLAVDSFSMCEKFQSLHQDTNLAVGMLCGMQYTEFLLLTCPWHTPFSLVDL